MEIQQEGVLLLHTIHRTNDKPPAPPLPTLKRIPWSSGMSVCSTELNPAKCDGSPPLRSPLRSKHASLFQVDTEEAVKEFEEALSTFDISGMAEEMGVPKDMVEVCTLIAIEHGAVRFASILMCLPCLRRSCGL